MLRGIVLLKIGMWWTCCWFQGGWLVIFVADGIRLGGERWGPVNAALNPTPGVAMRWAAWVRSAYCHVWMETEFTDLIKDAPTDGEAKKCNCRNPSLESVNSAMAKWHQRLLLINSPADDIIG